MKAIYYVIENQDIFSLKDLTNKDLTQGFCCTFYTRTTKSDKFWQKMGKIVKFHKHLLHNLYLFSGNFEHPDETPEPTKVETRDER